MILDRVEDHTAWVPPSLRSGLLTTPASLGNTISVPRNFTGVIRFKHTSLAHYFGVIERLRSGLERRRGPDGKVNPKVARDLVDDAAWEARALLEACDARSRQMLEHLILDPLTVEWTTAR
jgi:hypothetical protein